MTESKKVTLHGGPWHGKQLSIPEHLTHFHVVESANQAIQREARKAEWAEKEFAVVPVRQGTYSQVGIQYEDFEWDGWDTHD